MDCCMNCLRYLHHLCSTSTMSPTMNSYCTVWFEGGWIGRFNHHCLRMTPLFFFWGGGQKLCGFVSLILQLWLENLEMRAVLSPTAFWKIDNWLDVTMAMKNRHFIFRIIWPTVGNWTLLFHYCLVTKSSWIRGRGISNSLFYKRGILNRFIPERKWIMKDCFNTTSMDSNVVVILRQVCSVSACSVSVSTLSLL